MRFREERARDLSEPIRVEQEKAGSVKPIREEVGGTKGGTQPVGTEPGASGLREEAVSGK